MGQKMNRGKRQILFDYLPGKTFDFERVATIARVSSIRGVQASNLNTQLILRRIKEDVQAWSINFRPTLRDEILNDPSKFVLLDPKQVYSEMFPRVFWCQTGCGRVFDYTQKDLPQSPTCRVCKNGQLIQLRWIKIHSCGAITPLLPPRCQRCKNSQNMALDTRGSERLFNFRWICRKCNTQTSLYAGICNECGAGNMDIEVHRAGRTYFSHHAVVLNTPGRDLDGFLNLPEAPLLAAAKIFGLPEIAGQPLTKITAASSMQQPVANTGISGEDLNRLLERQARGEITPDQMISEMKSLREVRQQQLQAMSPSGIVDALQTRTGVERQVWERSAQEMLETVIPLEIRNSQDLFSSSKTEDTQTRLLAERIGLSRLMLIEDFPIITATYGFSRGEYTPDACRIRPFPPERDHSNKYPIFVDQVQADALLVTLDPNRVCTWLERNGYQLTLPNGTDPDTARRAYFINLFDQKVFGNKLGCADPEARMVFGLIHTLSHICIRNATLLCGLDRTSLSEYLLPRTLTFAIYCNHRFGATIGALTALFQQSIAEWLNAVIEGRRCVYDPVCRERESSCHACTHLAETSCRVFNQNLSRSFLFGGNDAELGQIRVGYFDPALAI